MKSTLKPVETLPLRPMEVVPETPRFIPTETRQVYYEPVSPPRRTDVDIDPLLMSFIAGLGLTSFFYSIF